VSTVEQSTANQLVALQQKGYTIEEHRWFAEQTSGGVPALKRVQFSKMADRMESGDVLLVLKLDRLGRDVQDILATVAFFCERGIRVKSLDLDGIDLTSAAGRLQLTVLAAVAAFERDRITERTKEGLARSIKKSGRPPASETTRKVLAAKASGLSQVQAMITINVSLPTIKRHWNKSL